ncbi:MAG: glucosaminidase domain-containing protein [Vulcanimicrobiota bacterium]
MDSLSITTININLGPQIPQGFPGTGYPGLDGGLALNRLTAVEPLAYTPINFAPNFGQAPSLGGMDPAQQMTQMTMQLMQMLLQLMQNQGKSKKHKKKHGHHGSTHGGSASPSSGAGGSGGVGGNTAPSIANTADGQKIDQYLSSKGSKAGQAKFGELAEKYGKQYDVDPLILLAIAGHETSFGTKGVGLNGLLGVGAYDSDPNNSTRNSHFSGVEQQLKVGAQTFANLRKKGGASSSDPIEVQTAAVNKAGWATDQNWHTGVDQMYRQVKQALA